MGAYGLLLLACLMAPSAAGLIKAPGQGHLEKLGCEAPGTPVLKEGTCCAVCEFGGEIPGTIDPSAEEIGAWYDTQPKIGGNPLCTAVWCPDPQCLEGETKYVPPDACCYQCQDGTRVHGGAGNVAHHSIEEREAHQGPAGAEFGYDAMSGTFADQEQE